MLCGCWWYAAGGGGDVPCFGAGDHVVFGDVVVGVGADSHCCSLDCDCTEGECSEIVWWVY